MLRRSWSLIVAASNENPQILDDRLGDRLLARTMTAPFLSWLVVSDEDRLQLQQSMREVLESRRAMRSPNRRSRMPGGGAAATRSITRGVSPTIKPEAAAPSEDFRRSLSLDLDMPRSAVERILGS
jgi:hypothetical protein